MSFALVALVLSSLAAVRSAAPGDVDALLRLAEQALFRGENQVARETAHRALAAAREAGDLRREGWALVYTGDAAFGLGEPRAALDAFHDALSAFRGAGDAEGIGSALKDLGIMQKDLGLYEEALLTLGEARERLRALGEPVLMGSAIENLGMVYASLGLSRLARERFEEAGRIAEDVGDAELAASARIRIGLMTRDDERALAIFREALSFAETSGRQPMIAWARLSMGQRLRGLGRVSEARAIAAAMADAYRASGNAPGEALALCDLAALELQTEPEAGALGGGAPPPTPPGDRGVSSSLAAAAVESRSDSVSGVLAAALESRSDSVSGVLAAAVTLRRALELVGHDSPKLRPRIQALLGEALVRLGDAAAAIQVLEEAVAEVEAVRGRLSSGAHRTGFMESQQGLYRRLMEAQLARGPAGEAAAFEALERGRSRDMLETLSADPIPNTSREAPPVLPELVAALGPREALLSFVASEGSIHVFRVTRAGLVVLRLAAPPGDVAARVEALVELLSRGDPGAWEIAARLGREIVSPWVRHLPEGIDELVIVPDGVLHTLPFEVLAGHASRLLTDDFDVTYAPSAKVWSELKRRGASGATADLLVLADPAGPSTSEGSRTRALYERQGFRLGPLPWSAREAREVAARASLGSEVLVGEGATESGLKARAGELSRFRIFHVAAHAVLSERDPARSALVLGARPGDGEDGFLKLSEVSRLRLGSDLVVLSACGTARGELRKGEGVASLATAFLHAGSRAVVASLWDVSDRRTVDLMAAFYGHLSAGAPAAHALRAAKLDLRRRSGTSSVGIWAPFVLLGAGDRPIPISGRPVRPRVAIGLAVALLLLSAAGYRASARRRARRASAA